MASTKCKSVLSPCVQTDGTHAAAEETLRALIQSSTNTRVEKKENRTSASRCWRTSGIKADGAHLSAVREEHEFYLICVVKVSAIQIHTCKIPKNVFCFLYISSRQAGGQRDAFKTLTSPEVYLFRYLFITLG